MSVLYEDYDCDTCITQPFILGCLVSREVPVYLPLFERVAKDRSDIFPRIIMVNRNGILYTNLNTFNQWTKIFSLRVRRMILIWHQIQKSYTLIIIEDESGKVFTQHRKKSSLYSAH